MSHVLIKEKKYSGQYVAIADFNKPDVIAHDKDPQKAYKKATGKGFSDPVILFVPAKNMVQIY
ncbi:MAG: DUF5678 domain-containing protein [Elusimicrobiota bacterium]